MYNTDLLKKYDTPAPRYTSYPTVPNWEEQTFSEEHWIKKFEESVQINNREKGVSIYIHLPFCEQLCTYCGCNKRITVNHQVEAPYIQALLKEWNLYRDHFRETPNIAEIHLGGGTPTFFSPENLRILLNGILENASILPNATFGVEVHPNYTTREHLKTLSEFGFTRLSAGIQDFDPEVKFRINRIQSFEKTYQVFQDARDNGFNSLNADIIYGLPFQSLDSIQMTIEKVKELRPDRIAFYSYAHVPWKSKSQRRYSEKDLPSGEEKRTLYETGKQWLLEAGYRELGMDHFALPDDELSLAFEKGSIHRNFMGYTVQKSRLLIGLGASSIGDTWGAFVQNEKEVETYLQKIDEGRFPFFKGHILTEEDLYFRQHILNLMCRMQTDWDPADPYDKLMEVMARLVPLANDDLVQITRNSLIVTQIGKTFIRNICMCFDVRFWEEQLPSSTTPVFSRSI